MNKAKSKWKSLLCMLLCATMVASTMLPGFAVSAESTSLETKATVEVTKYVSATGNDTTGDGSEAKPYATIAKAEAMLEADNGADLGKIIVSGSVAFDAATHKKMITIEGDGAEGTMISLEKAVRIAGPTTIDKITFKTNTNGFSLVTEGQELVIGEEVKAVKGSSVVLTFLVGDHWRGVGSGRPTVKINSNITLPTIIEVGSGYGNYTYPGADVTVNGGNLNQINLGKYNNTFTEDVNIVLSGISAIDNGIYDQKGNATFKKALQIVLNDGLSAAVVKDSIKNKNPEGGKWIMCGDKTGGSLSTTETAGSFMVNGDKIAVATLKTDETKVYKANPGENLVVPAGEYLVTYAENGSGDSGSGDSGSGDSGSGDVSTGNTLYVSAKGNDTTGNGSEEKPYASISKAEAVLEADKTVETGKIVISGSVVFSAADHTKMMTITGDGKTGTELRLGEGSAVPAGICGPTTIEQVDLKPLNSTFNAGLLETGQYELHFGKGVQVLRFNGFFRLGADKSAVGDASGSGSTPALTIDSLAHNNLEFSNNNIRIGTNGDGSWMNGANLTIDEGAVINEINIHRPTQFSKDVNIVINGGTVDKLTTTVKRIPGTYLFDKALQIVFNNGTRVSTFEKATFDSIQDNGGKWYMFGGKGGSLSVTDTAGTFVVNGENVAVATLKSDMTKVYKANPGEKLVVPAGEYYVTYGDNALEPDETEEVLPDGPKMIKLEFTKNGKDKIFGQNVELEKGKQYTIAFQRKFLEGGMNSTTYMLLKAALGSGKYTTYRSTHLDGEKGFSMSEDEDTSTVYYTFTHTEESGKYAVGFQSVKPSTFYIANMSLYETADTAKKNLLPSAKTEEKNLDGWGTDWLQAGENQKFEFKEGGIVRYIATVQQYDAKVFAPREIAPTMIYIDADKNAKDQIFGQNVKLEKGKNYTISFRYKFKEGDIDSSVFLRVKDPLKSGKYRSYHSSNSTGANGFELKYNKKTCQAQYSFTHTGESGTYAIGFQFSGVTKMYLTDFTVYETADSTKKNILPSRGNEDTLLGWGSDWASAENTITFQPKTNDGKVLYTVNAMPCDESIFKPDPELPPKMLYLENNGTYRQLVQRVKVVPGQKYRFSFCVASPIAVQGMVMHKGERAPIFNNMKPINEPDYKKDYYEVVYEFTLPNTFGGEAVDTGNVFVGIQFPAGSMGYVFNPKLWNVNDKEQENIYVNPGFNKGLDNWAFSWGAWFIPGLEGMGVNEFEKEGQFKLQVMKYDEEKFITYYDDSRFDDGEWWSADDIVKEKTGTATIQGRFLSESGSPISKAKMVLKTLKGSLECETDKDGKFHFGDLPAGFYELCYADSDGTIISTNFAQNIKDGYTVNVDVVAGVVTSGGVSPQMIGIIAGSVAGVSAVGGTVAVKLRKKKLLVKKKESE